MLAEFSIVPIGKDESLGKAIAEVLGIVDASGLDYKASAMGTIVEGDWDAVMGLIKKCHDAAGMTAPRLLTHITIDFRPGKPLDRLEEKLKSVEKRLGKELKK